ncbi:MAG TPA: FCD domain-containing protein, partial [Beijerinckiaceae bacterium]|nr:FCD domain-containing protein [Beijerinckiaceae bacterium]
LSPDAMAQVQDILAEQEQARRDPERFTRADDAFHRTIAEDVGIAQIWAVLEREKSQLDRVRFLSLPSITPVDDLIRQHKGIIAAIARRDPDAAEAAMRAHLSEVLKIVEKLAAKHPDLIVDDA